MRNYKNIEAWKLADDLAVEIYALTKRFPKEELYGITSQIRRAAVSVPANIAEGCSRPTNKDYLHFLHIARGSLTETGYFLHLAARLGFVSLDPKEPIQQQLNRTFACLHALIKAVETAL